MTKFTNIFLLRNFKKKEINLYITNIIADLEEDNLIYRIIGKLIKIIQSDNHDTLIFQYGDLIISEYNLDNIIEEKLKKGNYLENFELQTFSKRISLQIQALDEDNEKILLRYIGESLALTLKNRDEKILVYNEYGNKNVFNVTFLEKNKEFDLVSVFEGLIYRPIVINNQIALLVDAKSKFFTKKNLRDINSDGDLKKFLNRSIEKICPLVDCIHHLKPFGICEHGNPKYFGKLSDLDIENVRPSNCKINIKDYFKNESNCPTTKLYNEIKDEPPVIDKTFIKDSENEKVYSYPLELLRIIPWTEDAGSESSELSDFIKIPPKKRFDKICQLTNELLKSFYDFEFIILPLKILIFNEEMKFFVNYFRQEEYLINSEYTNLPVIDANEKKLGLHQALEKKLHFHIFIPHRKKYFDYLIPLIGNSEKHNSSVFFHKFAFCSPPYFNFYILDETKNLKNKIIRILGEKSDRVNFFIIVHEDHSSNNYKKLKSFLVQKDIPNQTIKYETLINYGYTPFTSSIFYQVILKAGGFTWAFDDREFNYNFLAISIKNKKNKRYASILEFNSKGLFQRGCFISHITKNFNKILKQYLAKFNVKSSFIVLCSGNFTKDQKKILEKIISKEKNHFLKTSEGSNFRFFDDYYPNYKVNKGIGVFNNQQLHIISYNYMSGTQKCLKITPFFKEDRIMNEIYEIVYRMTEFHPALKRNSIKLPFAPHFALETIRKGIELDLDTFEFKTPFFL